MIDIDKNLEIFYEREENKEDEYIGAISKHECVVDGWFVIELLEEVKRLREQYAELREALVGDSPNWTHDELYGRALELSNPAQLEFGEWHTDEGDD